MSSSHQTAKRRIVSIRWTLPLCVITPLVTGIALTSWLAFRSGQTAIEGLVDKVGAEVASNIEKQVNSYLMQPTIVSSAIAAEITSGNIATDSTRAIGQDFWQLTRASALTNNLYYGDQTGRFVYNDYQAGTSRLSFVDEETDFERITYTTDDAGNLLEAVPGTREYDPRGRSWYQEAVAHKKALWSSVYPARSRNDLTLTRATPVLDENGEIQGVLGIDVFLFELSDFLRSLEIGNNGQAFIVEPSGELIATSGDSEPFVQNGDEKTRLSAVDSPEPLVQATVQHILNEIGSLETLEGSQHFSFEVAGKKQLAYLLDPQATGVDWLIGVTIPQNDYMEKIHKSTQRTLLIGGGITLLTSLLGLGAALYIVRPIRQLTQAAQDIKNNRFQPDGLDNVIARPDEFSELAELFNDMATVIFSREQSLEDQVKQLKSEIDHFGGSKSDRAQLEALLKRAQLARQAYQKQT